ncbi:MAG: NAD(P)H-hydrate dehydratase [Saprospiraceae bacterium]|nr:NAD(P)H-hydrate dehydratase [Saprospiraceae bacterium]
MKLLLGSQIKEWDRFTITNEAITSNDLMERAGQTFVDVCVQNNLLKQTNITIFCGNGNNGGDGLVIARLLRDRFYDVSVFVLRFVKSDSLDFDINLAKLLGREEVTITYINHPDQFPKLNQSTIVIDALLGIGVNKAVDGLLKTLIEYINAHHVAKVISVDMPSGLPSEGILKGSCIKSDLVLTFQVPKLSFFLKENFPLCSVWEVLDIGLDKSFFQNMSANFYYVDKNFAKSILLKRTKYQHKGDFGHAAIVSGSKSYVGAAILATKACLRGGAGLVTTFVPSCAVAVIHQSVPESMVIASGIDFLENISFTEINRMTIGIGPGLGMADETKQCLEQILLHTNSPMVIDADALNIIAEDKRLLNLIPKYSIITPHPKEFLRLFGGSENSEQLFKLQNEKAILHQIIIVLKGSNTRICTPDGITYINSTGNPGMATGGSGDVLTGIITALLAQHYTAEMAAVLGVYLHGKAGDVSLLTQSHESLIASDLIDNFGLAFKSLM